MSGEVVLLSSAATSGALVIIAGGVAFLAVRAYLKAQADHAAQLEAKQQAAIVAWEAARIELVRQQAELAHYQVLWAQAPLTQPAPVAAPMPVTTPGVDFLQPDAATQAAWAALTARLAQVPPAWLADPQLPFAQLQTRAAALEAELARQTPQALSAFALTLQATWLAYTAELAARQHQQQQAQVRATTLHQALCQQRAMLVAPVADLEQLLARLEQWEPEQWATLAELESTWATLQPMLAQRLDQEAAQIVIADYVTQTLATLGYAPAQTFTTQAVTPDGRSLQAQFHIPGGERLRVVMQADLRLALQVVHERSEAITGPLDSGEARFWHQQEARWCADLPAFLAQLQAAGIHYAVGFERHTTLNQVPIVIVENAADWEAASAQVTHARHQS